uniref:Uncharacterized protein n=1 Tax=Oryza glumipatula TaxID=40148 RepID=A0A0D9ZUM2_9ORYZ
MAAMAARAAAVGTMKKARKPYTITRPRERWSAEEHERFLDALLLFGRDWKRIEGFVATKTAIQIRSHAQKHFLKARKFGLAGGLPPPLHPRRAALLRANAAAAAADMMPPPWLPSAGTPSCSGSGESWLADAAFFSQDETILLPISPGTGSTSLLAFACFKSAAVNSRKFFRSNILSCVIVHFFLISDPHLLAVSCSADDLGFAQVYKFIGDVFGSGEPRPVEAHLRRLQGMDPAISETILLVLKNLEANLSA